MRGGRGMDNSGKISTQYLSAYTEYKKLLQVLAALNHVTGRMPCQQAFPCYFNKKIKLLIILQFSVLILTSTSQGGGNAIYVLYRYVPLNRVCFIASLTPEEGIEFNLSRTGSIFTWQHPDLA